MHLEHYAAFQLEHQAVHRTLQVLRDGACEVGQRVLIIRYGGIDSRDRSLAVREPVQSDNSLRPTHKWFAFRTVGYGRTIYWLKCFIEARNPLFESSITSSTGEKKGSRYITKVTERPKVQGE